MNHLQSAANTHATVTPHQHQAEPDAASAQILRALELIHDSRSTNETRQEASRYLEGVKSQGEAPYYGYVLAANKSCPSIAQHFGLSLLEDAIRHHWAEYSEEQSLAVRTWVLKLAKSVQNSDPVFIRNKIAQLWVEMAKRSWGLDWLDMDDILVSLWAGSVAHKTLVLEILESLSENSFGKEDTITVLRGTELGTACVEIITPVQVFDQYFPHRDRSFNVRCGDEGWLARISDLLGLCIDRSQVDVDAATCAAKCLSTLKSIVNWAILGAVAATQCAPRICQALTSSSPTLQLLAIENLCSLYVRPAFSDDDLQSLVVSMYLSETITILKGVYEGSLVDANDIDDERYLLCKKFTEMMHNLGRFCVERPSIFVDKIDLAPFLALLLQILQNDSLHVSIPVLHLWGQLLRSPEVGSSQQVSNLIGPLLQICSQRLIRYEMLPAEIDLQSMVFLREDIDTMPERHAFLGNYTRFCKDIVENIVSRQPLEALSHIIGQADNVLQHMYDDEPKFRAENYDQASRSLFRLDAQFSVVEAALMGYGKWRGQQRSKQKGTGSPTEQLENINTNLQRWCDRLLEMTFDDPKVQQRIANLAVNFATGPLKHDPAFVGRVFKFLLSIKIRLSKPPRIESAPVYNNALEELQKGCSNQLQRLAMKATDFLSGAFKDIEQSVTQYCQTPGADEDDKDHCLSVLFVLIQRAADADDGQRMAWLESFIQPSLAKWQDPRLAQSLTNLQSFCAMLGLSKFERYFEARNATQVDDWTKVALDEEGLASRSRIMHAPADLPLRMTKILLDASLDRTVPGSHPHRVAHELWAKHLPLILPHVLSFIGLAHSFLEPAAWADSSPGAGKILPRIFRDRFWQVGISTGSRDDFYHKLDSSKTSLEGLASAIRGCLRNVREAAYRLLAMMTMLGDDLYRFEGLPMPLAKAMFENAAALSSHQTGVILETARPIIGHCPPDARKHFLTPFLTTMFDYLDAKIGREWETIDARNRDAKPDDDLGEEMKNESILRQLTFNCVTFVLQIFDPMSVPLAGKTADTNVQPLRYFVLESPDVFKSVILFCTHVLRMHDTRACGLITRVLRSIVAEFTNNTPVAAEIRQFISTEVFKACITSLHDPYFADMQGELAQLIATIVVRYSGLTSTPQQILLSLPGMDSERVESAIYRLYKSEGNGRQQRAVVLKLLEGLRGIRVSEQGRFANPNVKKIRSAMEEKYMTVEIEPKSAAKEPSPDLTGIADMFS